MKTLLLIAAIVCINISAKAQTESKISGDTLTTSTGFKIAKGDQVKVGVGSTPDGDFKFIRINSASVFNNYSVIKSYSNSANAFPRRNAGLSFKVIKVQERGDKKHGFVNYLVLGGGVRYEVDVDNAISSGELSIPEEFKPKSKGSAGQISVADELKKYKDLLDSGAITPEEYAAKKKQLLGL